MLRIALLIASTLAALPANADIWSLDGPASRLSFVSVKAGDIGEVNRFATLSGAVDEEGQAIVEIALASVDTGVEIRDERMKEHLFRVTDHPTARIVAAVDLDTFQDLDIGQSRLSGLAAELSLSGVTRPIETPVVVTRLAEDRVLVEAAQPVIIDAGYFELGSGVDKLRQLANLDSISLAVPATFRFVFERE